MLVVVVAVTLHLTILARGKDAHPDYVPDEKIAAMVAPRGGDKWIIQGSVFDIFDIKGRPQVGGGFGVLLNRHDGCVLEVVENMN